MRTTRTRVITTVLAVPVFALSLAACSGGGNSAVNHDEEQTNDQLTRYQANQPVPFYDSSQIRDTVIAIETAQANGIATTSAFFNQGTDNPIAVCSSIGYPVPSTTQVTNPDQTVYSDTHDDLVVAQMEPTGIYTGESTATYVMCVDPNGLSYPFYWEGFVATIGGPGHWDAETGTMVLDGDPTSVTTDTEN